MRTTIDLPDPLVERVKVSAAKHRTTMRELVIQGLEEILSREEEGGQRPPHSALERIKRGYSLGNQPLTREEAHAR